MSKNTHIRAIAAVGAATVIGAVLIGAPANAAESPIPAKIRPPAGSKLLGAEIVRSGTQTYTCAATGTYVGTASTPEATLIGNFGLVHHFGGPSWQAQPPFDKSSSKVTAARVDGVDKPGTIPWLLLKVNGSTGTGPLAKTKHIQRLATSGGVAPTEACTAGQKVSIPYGAIYVFWG